MTAAPDGRSMRERMLAGDLYIPAPELGEHHLRAMDLLEDAGAE